MDDWVEWSPCSKINKMNITVDVVKLSANGRVKFLDPRDGRVKAFPFEATRGNYSISICDLQPTDLGCYRCKLRNVSFKVELSAEGKWCSNFYIFMIQSNSLCREQVNKLMPPVNNIFVKAHFIMQVY